MLEFFQILAIALIVVLGILLFLVVKRIVILLINSTIGLFALFGFNYVMGADLTINFWSVLLTAVGGIFGFLLVITLHFLKWAF